MQGIDLKILINNNTVVQVTGGNKGIGFATVKALCQQYNGNVYLTARDTTRGLNAVSELKKQGLNPKFHQLDVNDDNSVNTFRDYLQNTYGGLDVLVNNAAIMFQNDAAEPFGFQAEETIRINYFSLRRVCTALYPVLRPHARVVHVSSGLGCLSQITGGTLKKKLANPNLTETELDKIMHEFVNAAKSGTHLQVGWSNSAYVASKIGVSALAGIHQSMFNVDPREDIVVNAVHPGYVDTDMTLHKGILTPDQGAIGPVYCALLPKNTEIKGKFIWYDKTLADWK
ncbi:PREDICTED: carbonyl reductase [NADPH] 1-like [Cyphomyrmex costatus]|uniref:carbonyl reductase (NADPH) n=1 Tax=Cyphomyrmex costatus TaxID=456900 RepID=A0A195CWJ9_9HYME|nr:PREDICTED: carbonyl reductase [NADPH] 1-like [Cyphomyrmex costatus]KYN04529.1 Carbonyl reductase [NADPH] 1 [Cyphomyrmex costatus]